MSDSGIVIKERGDLKIPSFISKSDYVPIFFLLISMLVISSYNPEGRDIQNGPVKQRLYPPLGLTSFNLGYNDILADMLWIRVIQDIDYCENASAEKSYNTGISAEEALAATVKPSRCNRGWVFQYLNLVTDLAPRFRSVYYIGASSLAVGVDDKEGAKILIEKGIKNFPREWRLSYLGSYIYLFEFQQPERAADLLMQASQYGGPNWLPILASRLYSNTGRKALGRSVLIEYLKTNPGGKAEERARQRLKELEQSP